MFIKVIDSENEAWEKDRRKNPTKRKYFSGNDRELRARHYVSQWLQCSSKWNKYFSSVTLHTVPILVYRALFYESYNKAWADDEDPNTLVTMDENDSPLNKLGRLNHRYQVLDMVIDIEPGEEKPIWNPSMMTFRLLIRVYNDLGHHGIPQLWICFPNDSDGLMAKMQLSQDGTLS